MRLLNGPPSSAAKSLTSLTSLTNSLQHLTLNDIPVESGHPQETGPDDPTGADPHLNEPAIKHFVSVYRHAAKAHQEESRYLPHRNECGDEKGEPEETQPLNETSLDGPHPCEAGWVYDQVQRRFVLHGLVCRIQGGEDLLKPRFPELTLGKDIYGRLMPHQRRTIFWMYELFKRRYGGILADDMGLGKTVQTSAFLRAITKAGLCRFVLLVIPLSLLPQWESEVQKWAPCLTVYRYHGSEKERSHALRSVTNCISTGTGSVLLTTYDTLRNGVQVLRGLDKDEVDRYSRPPDFKTDDPQPSSLVPWDVVVLDEAHKIKNPTAAVSKAVRLIHSHQRLLLTGTPLQNRLEDLWALMDVAAPGLLGNFARFKASFAEPIRRGNAKGASPLAVAMKNEISKKLKSIINPHFLRRKKEDIFTTAPTSANQLESDGSVSPHPTPLSDSKNHLSETDRLTDPAHPTHPTPIGESVESITEVKAKTKKKESDKFTTLPNKTELVVYLRLTKEQEEPYTEFLSSKMVRDIINKPKQEEGEEDTSLNTPTPKVVFKSVNVLTSITCLKKICKHPVLSLPVDQQTWRRFTFGERGDDLEKEKAAMTSSSSKLGFLNVLLPSLVAANHKVLVFSESTAMLDLVELCVCRPRELRWQRIDGSVVPIERPKRIRKFTNSKNTSILLLTTTTGGVGLNLVAADRVVLLDPSWNPSTDNQAVDRAYRMGQTRDVVVYRLISAGAIEEHMYRIQIFKSGLTKTALECEDQIRYFTLEDLRKMFSYDYPPPPKPLKEHHEELNITRLHAENQAMSHLLKDIKEERDFISQSVVTVSDHRLLFSQPDTSSTPSHLTHTPHTSNTSLTSSTSLTPSTSLAPQSITPHDHPATADLPHSVSQDTSHPPHSRSLTARERTSHHPSHSLHQTQLRSSHSLHPAHPTHPAYPLTAETHLTQPMDPNQITHLPPNDWISSPSHLDAKVAAEAAELATSAVRELRGERYDRECVWKIGGGKGRGKGKGK
eukprot:GHVN01079939.1.p1 GENE.GHVN01079939.1~~GHVN01079939.1.p1  ORF type:complete len:1023 (-),score=243.51 GHVN01079939.1:38-3052(-)